MRGRACEASHDDTGGLGGDGVVAQIGVRKPTSADTGPTWSVPADLGLLSQALLPIQEPR